jgi:hypothetical protein
MQYHEHEEREAEIERAERRDERDERFSEHQARRGFILQGKWHAIHQGHEELFDTVGVSPSMTWDNEHDYLEDLDACLKGLTEVMHTPRAVAANPSILFLDWMWRWDAEDGVFRGRKKRHFDKEGSNANHQG